MSAAKPPPAVLFDVDGTLVDSNYSQVTSAADVEAAKPNSAIIEVALNRAGVTADRAVFVGDSVWDAKASARAGCRALLSGGLSRDELMDGGARIVFANAAQLTERIDETPIASLV